MSQSLIKVCLVVALGVCVTKCDNVPGVSTTTMSTIINRTLATPAIVKPLNVQQNTLKENLNKRNAHANSYDSRGASSTAQAKSYDPPPEFYRGPGSYPTPSSLSSYDTSISKPIAFPDANGRDKYGATDASIPIASAYNKWQLLKGNYNNKLQDRISVGHYGSPDHGANGYGSGTGSGIGYGNYETRPYGETHHAEYAYASPSPYPAHGYQQSHAADGIPFDVYGTKGHYAGAGGEYSYSTYPEHLHEPASHKGPPDYSRKVLLAKSFLIPLASAAVLGIAAALVSNPLLLQLGTVSAVGPAVVGKRRRRRAVSAIVPDASVELKAAHDSAYRAHSGRHTRTHTRAPDAAMI